MSNNQNRVLIAEDDFLVSKAIIHILKGIGYESVGTAPSGKEAVEMTKSLRPDVVLMDIRMPGMDGFEATQKIQETCPTPVVILTAHLSKEFVDKATDLGVSAYLVKPPNPDEIERAIKIAIARHGDMMELRRLNNELEEEIINRKKIEKQLRASDRTHRTLAKNLPGIVYRVLLRENNRILFFNEMLKQITGYKSDELTKHEVCCLVPLILPEDTEGVISSIKRAVKKQEPFEIEYRLRRKDNEMRDVVEIGRVIPGSDDKPKYIDGVIFDITERKHIEEIQRALYQISESANNAKNLQQLYRRIHGIIGELMPAKNFYIALYESGKDKINFPYYIEEFSKKAMTRKFGKGLTEYIIRTGKPLLACEDDLAELRKKGEIEISGKEAIYWLGIPLKENGSCIGVIVVQSYDKETKYSEEDKEVLIFVSEQIAMAIEHVRSAEEIKKTRDQLRSLSARLQELREEEKVKMTYGIREDFGQLLSVLKMDLSWLNNNLTDENSKEKAKIKSMLELINVMVEDVQKATAELRPSHLDFLGVIPAIKWYCKEFEKRNGIKCITKFNPKEIELSKNISVTLYRIFETLLGNVEKHSNANFVQVSLKLNRSKLMMVINDDGISIAKEKLNDPKSIGLLSIKERLMSIDGDISIKGIPGKGSEVIVSIPIKKVNEKL